MYRLDGTAIKISNLLITLNLLEGVLNNTNCQSHISSIITLTPIARGCSIKFVQQGHSRFRAPSVLLVHERRKMATCLCEAPPAKAGNVVGGFFQQPLNEEIGKIARNRSSYPFCIVTKGTSLQR